MGFIEKALDFFNKNILGALKEITVVDILDILVLSIIIYVVFKFIRERRAGRLALGLFIFALILLLSSVLNLKAIKYIFQNFYQIGLIALVIIFQADLRAGLEKVGNSPIRSLKKTITESDFQATVQLAETLSNVCDSLSRTRTGALIAIEVDTKLGDYLGQGSIINADANEMLIRNIFFNKAPLHDGAMIIRNRRVFAAGCYLPLSTADVNRDLGTRHRAAIGLSEQSDAVVLVVSEETGTISIAKDGKLTSNYNYTSLKQAIITYLAPQDAEKIRQRSIRRLGKRGSDK